MNGSVSQQRDADLVYLSLGANIGNREQMLAAAIQELKKNITGLRTSGIYETEAMYVVDQPRFLNAVVSGATGLGCEEFLAFTQKIEMDLGRVRLPGAEKGPRSIDIDILLFGGVLLNSSRLVLPHPGIEQRLFVLVPLLELDSQLRNPSTGKAFSLSLEALPDQGVYTYQPKDYNLILALND